MDSSFQSSTGLNERFRCLFSFRFNIRSLLTVADHESNSVPQVYLCPLKGTCIWRGGCISLLNYGWNELVSCLIPSVSVAMHDLLSEMAYASGQQRRLAKRTIHHVIRVFESNDRPFESAVFVDFDASTQSFDFNSRNLEPSENLDF